MAWSGAELCRRATMGMLSRDEGDTGIKSAKASLPVGRLTGVGAAGIKQDFEL